MANIISISQAGADELEAALEQPEQTAGTFLQRKALPFSR